MTRVQLEFLATVFDHTDKSMGRLVAIENIIQHAQILERTMRRPGNGIDDRVRAVLTAAVAPYPGLTVADILGPSRMARTSKARREAMLALSDLSLGPSEIGRIFRGRDHSTAFTAIKKARAERLALEIRFGAADRRAA